MPINEERLRKMQDLGLTEYQARVYLTLLDFGEAIASQLPSLSRVPRTRIYSVMDQLHEKGLVEIIPVKPRKYRPVPISSYIEKVARDLKSKAKDMEKQARAYSREFEVKRKAEAEKVGRLKAIYGRRNVREVLSRMYDAAREEVISIGTVQSPKRILGSRLPWITRKSKEGLDLKYAFPVNSFSMEAVKKLTEYADVRSIDMILPIYFLVVDAQQVLICHPIPNDESFLRGDDIAIWTDDEGMSEAMRAIAYNIWNGGREPGTIDTSATLLSLARGYSDMLELDHEFIFESLGSEIGKQIASLFKGLPKKEALSGIEKYWQDHGLGRIKIGRRKPMKVSIERFADCNKMMKSGKAVCGYVESLVTSLLEGVYGRRIVIEETDCGAKMARCELTMALGPKNP